MIRKATLKDKESVLKIYEEARAFIKTYNSPQWQDGYPNEDTFNKDIKDGTIYVNEVEGIVVGVATFLDYEPTYEEIDGAWLNDEEYVVIHRIATTTSKLGKGHAKAFIDYLENNPKVKNIKIDTHELNEPMKRFLIKNGFIYCGIITLNNPVDKLRLAYQKVVTKNK